MLNRTVWIAEKQIREAAASRHRHAIAIFTLCLLSGLAAQPAEVTVGEGAPFFQSPDSASSVLGTLGARTKLQSLEQRVVRPLRNPHLRRDDPLSFIVTFHRVALPDGREAWVSPDLVCNQELGVILPRPFSSLPWLGVAFALFAAVAVVMLALAKRERLTEAWQATAPLPLRRSLALLGAVVLLELLLFAWMRGKTGCVVPALTDELDYFAIARDLISGTPPADWHFNISIAALYVPLILLTGATSYLDIHAMVSFLNVAVFTPLTLVMVYYLVEKASQRPRVALATVACLVVLPLIYYPIEWHREPSVFKCLFGAPFFGPTSCCVYYYSVWSGWNGLADTASTFVVTLTLFLATFLRRRDWVCHVVLGAVFGLACFLRINNIFFAPVVAYLLWRRNVDLPIPRIFWHGAAAVGTFLLCVAPQFIANRLQFGSFLTFPYVLHGNGASQGFEWSSVRYSTHFLMGTNWLHMAAGVVGVLMLCHRPAGRLFALWSIPLILFFCGYTVTGASPMRFTLSIYAPLWGAFFLAADRVGAGRKPWLVWLFVVANAVLVSPCQRASPPHGILLSALSSGHLLVQVLAVVVPTASLLALILGLKGRARVFWFLALLVYHTGWWGVPPILMVLALSVAVWGWVGDVRTLEWERT